MIKTHEVALAVLARTLVHLTPQEGVGICTPTGCTWEEFETRNKMQRDQIIESMRCLCRGEMY